MDRAEFQRLFADLNEKHLASGLSPNEACARALVEANKLAKGVVPGQSGSGASSLRVTKDEEDAASQPKSKAGGGSSRNEAASDSSAMRDDGPGLSLAILRPLAEEAAREGGSKSACVRVVGRVFGDLEALGQSFLLSEKEQRQSSALDSSGLDLDAVVEAYTLISSAKLTEVLAGAMERLVTPGSLLSLRSSVQSKSTAGMSKQPGKAPTNGKRKRGKADAIDEGQDNKSGESGSGSGSSSADSMGSSGISTGAVSPYLDLAEDEAAQVGPRLRVLQILLLAPLLEDPDYHEKLVLPICDCINSLPLPAKLALVYVSRGGHFLFLLSAGTQSSISFSLCLTRARARAQKHIYTFMLASSPCVTYGNPPQVVDVMLLCRSLLHRAWRDAAVRHRHHLHEHARERALHPPRDGCGDAFHGPDVRRERDFWAARCGSETETHALTVGGGAVRASRRRQRACDGDVIRVRSRGRRRGERQNRGSRGVFIFVFFIIGVGIGIGRALVHSVVTGPWYRQDYCPLFRVLQRDRQRAH